MRSIITLKEYFASPKVISSNAKAKAHYALFPDRILTKHTDLGDQRIADLDGVMKQVISHRPGDVDASIYIKVNDDLAAIVKKNPTYLAGFAILPINDLAAAVSELKALHDVTRLYRRFN